MAMRKVTVISTSKTTPQIVNTEAITWGQLKDNLSGYGELNKLRAVVKESKATLELDEASLPEGDFTLFLTVKNIKAGGNDVLARVLETLQEKFNSAFEDVIESLQDGEFGEVQEEDVQTSGCGSYTKVEPRVVAPRISNEDQEMLDALANL